MALGKWERGTRRRVASTGCCQRVTLRKKRKRLRRRSKPVEWLERGTDVLLKIRL